MVPPPLLREPKLKQGDLELLDAFYVLSHSRPSSGVGGPSAIPVTEIFHYLVLVGIDSRDERLKYLRIVQRLDAVYLTDASEKIKSQSKNKKPH